MIRIRNHVVRKLAPSDTIRAYLLLHELTRAEIEEFLKIV
jgi:hypothetical protein